MGVDELHDRRDERAAQVPLGPATSISVPVSARDVSVVIMNNGTGRRSLRRKSSCIGFAFISDLTRPHHAA
jgi:hypothetical protein